MIFNSGNYIHYNFLLLYESTSVIFAYVEIALISTLKVIKQENKILNRLTLESKKKVKDTALDFTVPTCGADLCFSALQLGSAMGPVGQPSYAFAHPSCLPSPYFSRYPFRAG